MSADIRIRKGADIKLQGTAEKVISEAPKPQLYSLQPSDFHAITPKMVVKEGEAVKKGQVLFYSKYQEAIKFVSPVSGKLKEIRRGPKRRIEDVIVETDGKDRSISHEIKDFDKLDADDVKRLLLDSGNWPFIRQRPYDIIANPNDKPKAIFISCLNTAPLAADLSFILENRRSEFETGLQAIAKLTTGKVHVCVAKKENTFLTDLDGATVHRVRGPHPAGNVGVQIHKINPLNTGERVWVVHAQDVAAIGSFFKTGSFDASRIIALAGSEVKKPQYYHSTIGAQVSTFVYDAGVKNPANIRIISGDVLTGTTVSPEGFLGFYDNTVSVIPEGRKHRMFGWMPFLHNHIHSLHHSSFAWLFPNKKYQVNTNLNGEERALVVTGEMESVFPMDVYPMQLLKACMAGNIEKMENLGIYEVAPEDFALVDYINTSKLEAQEIVRDALDLMITEVG